MANGTLRKHIENKWRLLVVGKLFVFGHTKTVNYLTVYTVNRLELHFIFFFIDNFFFLNAVCLKIFNSFDLFKYQTGAINWTNSWKILMENFVKNINANGKFLFMMNIKKKIHWIALHSQEIDKAILVIDMAFKLGHICNAHLLTVVDFSPFLCAEEISNAEIS